VKVSISEPAEDYPYRDQLREAIRAAVGAVDGVEDVEVHAGVLDDDGQERVRRMLIGDPESTAGSQASHGHAEGRSIPFAEPGATTRVLLIASGKGGVGKSSITANLAIALAQRGKKVGIVDADVWGFSIPRMLGVTRPPVLVDRMLIPPKAHGVRAISMGFFAEEETPVIWRGPMLHKALEQFLTDVWWGDPDFLLVDLPPGTGDISISLAQFLPRAEVFVVTTPQAAAQKVAQRAAYMAEKVRLEVRGVIENMSWFTGDDGTRYELFGAGGGQELADQLDVALVGQVPLVPDLREGSDIGRPITAEQPDSEVAAVFRAMAEKVDVELAPTKRYHPELKIG
jgi:ATP-binding protein involved in chromosome partitioning